MARTAYIGIKTSSSFRLHGTRRTPTAHLGFCLLLSWQILIVHANGFDEHLPIGAIVDQKSVEIQSAFSYEIKNHNSENQSNMKLNTISQMIQVNDSYSLTSTICSQMADGIFALFGTHSVVTLPTLRSFTSTFHMPFVTTSMAVKDSGQELGYELYMRPLYTQAIIDVIKHYHWTKVYYIYSTQEGLFRLQQLFEAISENDLAVEVKVYQVHDVSHVIKIIEHLDEFSNEEKRILLDMPTEDCDDLLKEQKSDPRRVKLHYLIVGLGFSEMQLDNYTSGGIKVTGFSLVNFQQPDVRRFFEDWDRSDSQSRHGPRDTNTNSYEAALAVDSVHLMIKAFTKMLTQDPNIFSNILHQGDLPSNGTGGIDCDSDPIIPWRHGYALMKAMKEIEFNGLSGKVAFDNTGLRRDFRLDISQVHLTRGPAQIGSWTPRKGLEITTPSLVRIKDKNRNAHRTLIVTSILTEPFLTLRPDSPNSEPWVGNDKYEGYCADLAKIIAQITGYSYLIKPVGDGKYGYKDENGTWNGMVGELINNKADLAIAPLTITSNWERVIDFSKPFMNFGISIMMKKPMERKPGIFSFMYPFSYEVWLCILFAYISVSVTLCLVSRWSPLEWHTEDNHDGPRVTNRFTISNSLWYTLGAFLQQGYYIEPRSIPGRIVGGIWWFFTLVIVTSYISSLIATFRMARMQSPKSSPIQSAHDLTKQTEIKYGMVEGGSTMEFFRGSTTPTYEQMWGFMSSAEPSVFVASNEEGVKRVLESNGRYAFIADSTTIDYLNQRKPCDTIKVSCNLNSKWYGIGTPLGSDLREIVDLAVLELRENGELQRLERKWWYDKNECGKESSPKKLKSQSYYRGFTLTKNVGLFYILIGGLVLALIVAILEFLWGSKVEATRHKMSFSKAARSQLLLSIKGKSGTDQKPASTPVLQEHRF